METKIPTVDVAQELASIITFRDAIMRLRESILNMKTPKVILDLAKVEFISRSAAHELLTMKEQLANQEPKVELELINTSESIANMLRVVAASRTVPKEAPATEDIQVVPFEELVSPKPATLSFWRRLFAH